MDHPSFKYNCKKFSVTTAKELNKHYVCRKCRRDETRNVLTVKQSQKTDTDAVKKLERIIQEEVDLLIERGVNNPIALKNFDSNIKSILEERSLKDWGYDVRNGMPIGLKIKKTLVGDIYIKIKGLAKE